MTDLLPTPRIRTSASARWLTDLPTRVHLWRAEHELRHRTVGTATPGLAAERSRQLDRLRDYRRAREFPRNAHSHRPRPVFIDDDGGRCAVAHLMIESGESTAADDISATSSYARIRAMNPVVIDDWASRSGLTPKALARIQPEYPPVFDPAGWLVTARVVMFVLVPWSFATIALNALRLARIHVTSTSRLGRVATRVATGSTGVVVGMATLAVGLALHFSIELGGWVEVDTWGEWDRQPVRSGAVAMIVGSVALLTAAAYVIVTRRRRTRHPSSPANPT